MDWFTCAEAIEKPIGKSTTQLLFIPPVAMQQPKRARIRPCVYSPLHPALRSRQGHILSSESSPVIISHGHLH
jgi:hypothetical protein